MRVVTTAHRVWIGMDKNAPYSCLEATLSSYDLAISKSSPIQHNTNDVIRKCDARSQVPASNTWYKFPLYRNKAYGNWARVNPGQYLKSEVKEIKPGQYNSNTQYSYITDRLQTKCGCVDNTQLLKLTGKKSLSDLNCIKSGEVFLDCVPFDLVSADKTPWNTDQDGRPGTLAIRQDHGNVKFKWTDYSECEKQFHLTRDGETFIDDFLFNGNKRCGEVIAPEDISDDLQLAVKPGGQSGRAVGSTHKYCVKATAMIGAGAGEYSSPPSCTTLTVAFNTAFRGKVLTHQAKLPVEGVTVTYKVASTGTTGSAVSAKDGSFRFHIVDTKSSLNVEDVVVSFRKQTKTASGTIDHLFQCDGSLCGPGIDKKTKKAYPDAQRVIKLSHLSFHTDIIIGEASSVPFTGTVSFPSVRPYPLKRGTAAPAQGAWPWGEAETMKTTPCYLPKAKVCLLNYKLGNTLVACDTTDSQGRYSLAAPLGLHVVVQVQYASHGMFVRSPTSRKMDATGTANGLVRGKFVTWKNETQMATQEVKLVEMYYIAETSGRDLWTGMHFEDRTTKRVTLGAHGTLCKLPLGDKTMFDVQHATGNCYAGAKHTVLDTKTHADASFLMPAHLLDVSLDSVDPAYPQATDAGQMGYFHRLRNRTQRIDLVEVKDEDPPTEAVFQYHPKPTITVMFKDSAGAAIAKLTCPNVTANAGDDSQVIQEEPSYRFKAGQVITASAYVKEVLQAKLGECSHVEGAVQIHSRLGLGAEDQATLARDPTQPEYKEITKVLLRSIGSLDLISSLVRPS